MVLVAFNSKSDFIWIPRDKSFILDAREYVRVKIVLDYPSGAPKEIIPSSYVRTILSEIGIGYPKNIDITRSAADWYNITRAAHENIRIANGRLRDKPGQWDEHQSIFKPKPKKRLPKRDLSELSKSGAKDRLKKMAKYNRGK